jgi:hypothetical protein
MGTAGAFYNDAGPYYFTRLNPGRAKQRAVSQREAVGYAVTLRTAHNSGESKPHE